MVEGQFYLFAFLAAIPVAATVAFFRWGMGGKHLLTPVFVMIGNLAVIIVAAFRIGQDAAVFLFLLFACAAIPVSIEYYISAWFLARNRARKKQERDF